MTPDYTVVGAILTWPQATVAVVLTFAVMVWPGMFIYLNARRVKAEAASARQEVQEVKATLTTNNGGSTVKDSLDRIERNQIEFQRSLMAQHDRLEALEDYLTGRHR